MPPLPKPAWLSALCDSYNSDATNLFTLYGNTSDSFLLKSGEGNIRQYLQEGFGTRKNEVTLHLDPSSGIRLEGSSTESKVVIDAFLEKHPLPSNISQLIETAHQFLLFLTNLTAHYPATVFINNPAYLVGKENKAPDALLIKRWSEDPRFLKEMPLIVLIAEELSPLHELILKNSRIEKIEVPYPGKAEILELFARRLPMYPAAFQEMDTLEKKDSAAEAMVGTSLSSLDRLIKKQAYKKEPLKLSDLAATKRTLVAQESRGMIEFLEPKGSLDDLTGASGNAVKEQFLSDIALWNSGKTFRIPNGILLVGPPGTGKTFLLRCLAGSTNIPIAEIKNFRGQFQGESEGNLELIFRLLRSLPQVYVFIDEAEQSLGGRQEGGTDGGLSGRIYSKFATEMSNLDNKGRMCWVLATSHPHLMEPDLKRPGRIDLIIPLLPCENALTAETMLREIATKKGLSLNKPLHNIPELLTAGAATTLIDDVLRRKDKGRALESDADTLNHVLANYQPRDPAKMIFLTKMAIKESTSKEFIPDAFLQDPRFQNNEELA
jgi:AAA+ superfamily predicted ATPase